MFSETKRTQEAWHCEHANNPTDTKKTALSHSRTHFPENMAGYCDRKMGLEKPSTGSRSG